MNRIVKAVMALGLSAGICLSFAGCGQKSTAPVTLPNEQENTAHVTSPEEQNEYSIITKLDLNIDFDGNTVKGTVKNSFTLFPATARVYVYLYFSESYTTDYTKMQEVANAYTEDLDMNKTLTATYDMQGEIGYFLARMRYRIDLRGWEERTTDAYKHSYSGIYMQTISDDGSLPVFEDIQLAFERNPLERETILKNYYVVFDATTIYSKFANDYLKEYNKPLDKEFYLLSLKTNEYYDTDMPNPVWCSLYKFDDREFFEYNVFTYIKELGFSIPPSTDPSGLGFCNLRLYFVFANLESKLNGKLRLEFGQRDGKNNLGETENGFINLYIGETCIGTCYYTSYAEEKISYAFFYNLFVDNLRSNFEIV